MNKNIIYSIFESYSDSANQAQDTISQDFGQTLLNAILETLKSKKWVIDGANDSRYALATMTDARMKCVLDFTVTSTSINVICFLYVKPVAGNFKNFEDETEKHATVASNLNSKLIFTLAEYKTADADTINEFIEELTALVIKTTGAFKRTIETSSKLFIDSIHK